MLHLLTAWSKEYEPLALITYPGKLYYSRRWGHSCHFNVHTEGESIAWERPKLWLMMLENICAGEWIWFTGCDVLITNPEIDISIYADEAFDLIVASDCNCAQSDSFLIRSNERTRAFLKRVIAVESTGRFKNEQEAWTTLLSNYAHYDEFFEHVGYDWHTQGLHNRLEAAMNQSDVRVKLVSQKLFNAYHEDHYLHGVPTDGTRWEPTDLALHMASKPLDYRLEHLPQFVPEEHANLQGFLV